jgi:hypothetical protein
VRFRLLRAISSIGLAWVGIGIFELVFELIFVILIEATTTQVLVYFWSIDAEARVVFVFLNVFGRIYILYRGQVKLILVRRVARGEWPLIILASNLSVALPISDLGQEARALRSHVVD